MFVCLFVGGMGGCVGIAEMEEGIYVVGRT